MLYDLLNRDISGFNVANFPRTSALVDQQMRTLEALISGGQTHSVPAC